MAALSTTTRQVTPRALSTSLSQVAAEPVVVAVVLAVAAILRFAALGGKSFWVDEAYSAFLANQPIKTLVRTLIITQEPHPPLYYLLLSLWGHLAGKGDVALRSLSVIFGILMVAGTYWLGKRLGGVALGALAAFLTAISPFQVVASQEARMYPLLGLLTLCSWAGLIAATEGRWSGWVVYVVATTLALYTHYFAIFSLIGQGTFVLITNAGARQRWLVSQLVILVLFLPWLGLFFDTYVSGRGWPFFRPPLGVEAVTGLLGFLSFGGFGFGFESWFGGPTASVLAQSAILVPFLILATAGIITAWKHPRLFWLVVGYLGIPVAVPMVFSLRHNIFYGRYFSYVFPAFAILCGWSILAVAAYVGPTWRRGIALILALGFLVFNAPVLADVYANPKFEVFPWRSVAATVASEARPTDLIVIIPPYSSVPFTRYFRGSQQLVPIVPREFGDITTGRKFVDPAADTHIRTLFRSYAAQHEVMWVVVTGPVPEGAIERFGNLMSGIYDLNRSVDFNSIRVFRAKRHSPKVADEQ